MRLFTRWPSGSAGPEPLRFPKREALYTDMNAIRREEDTDNLHSLYVDQWDWEKIIGAEERTVETLKAVVNQLYSVLKATETFVCGKYAFLQPFLPEKITFITSQELLERYPTWTPRDASAPPRWNMARSSSCRSAESFQTARRTTAARPITTIGPSTGIFSSITRCSTSPWSFPPWASA